MDGSDTHCSFTCRNLKKKSESVMFACEKLNMHVNQCIYSPDTDMTQAPKALKYKVLPDNVA